MDFCNFLLSWADSNERGFPCLLCSSRGRLNMAARRGEVTVYVEQKSHLKAGRREGY